MGGWAWGGMRIIPLIQEADPSRHKEGNGGLETILKITQRWLQAVTEKWGRKGFPSDYRVYSSIVRNYFMFRPMVVCMPSEM